MTFNRAILLGRVEAFTTDASHFDRFAEPTDATVRLLTDNGSYPIRVPARFVEYVRQHIRPGDTLGIECEIAPEVDRAMHYDMRSDVLDRPVTRFSLRLRRFVWLSAGPRPGETRRVLVEEDRP